MWSANYPTKRHPVLVIQRDKEILLTTPCGQEIASLTVQTMEDGNGNPTENFWLCFKAKVAGPDKNSAMLTF